MRPACHRWYFWGCVPSIRQTDGQFAPGILGRACVGHNPSDSTGSKNWELMDLHRGKESPKDVCFGRGFRGWRLRRNKHLPQQASERRRDILADRSGGQGGADGRLLSSTVSPTPPAARERGGHEGRVYVTLMHQFTGGKLGMQHLPSIPSRAAIE